jgi:CSLREA domain-containing protein
MEVGKKGTVSFLLFTIISVFILSVTAFSATISVNTSNDELNNDGDCSLREAIHSANKNIAVSGCNSGSAGLDVIQIGGGIYSLTIPGKNEDLNATGDLDILESVEIRGSGAIIQDGVSQQGVMGDGIRLIHVDPTGADGIDLSMNGVTLQNADLGCNGFNCENGAAVIHFDGNGDLVFENGDVLNNTVSCTGLNCGSSETSSSTFISANPNMTNWLDYDTDQAPFGSEWIFLFGGALTMRNVRIEDNLGTCASTSCFAGGGIVADEGTGTRGLLWENVQFVGNRLNCKVPDGSFCETAEFLTFEGEPGSDAIIRDSILSDNIMECYGTDCDTDEFLELDNGKHDNILFERVEIRNNTLFCRGDDCDSDELFPTEFELSLTLIDVVIEGNTLKCEGLDCDADELTEMSGENSSTTIYRNVRVLNNISTCTGIACNSDEIADDSHGVLLWENTEWINNETSCFGVWCHPTDIWDNSHNGAQDSIIRDSVFINNRIICDGQDCTSNSDIFDVSASPANLIYENVVIIDNLSSCRNNTNCSTSNELFDTGDNLVIRNSTIANNHLDFADNIINGDTDLIIEKSAIVGNTGGPGLIVVDEPGSTLINNWWGCNEGPNMPGCDTANVAANFDPWLIMTLEIEPNPARIGDLNNNVGSLADPGALASVHFFTNSNGETIPNTIQRPVSFVVTEPASISRAFAPLIAFTLPKPPTLPPIAPIYFAMLSLLLVTALSIRYWEELMKFGRRRVATAALLLVFAAATMTGCGLALPLNQATSISFGGIAQVTITSHIPGQVTLTATADNEIVVEEIFFIP